MRIVIIGGGFAGVKCAKALRKKLPPSQCEIVLFNRENHMVFHPLLAEVVSAGLQPKDVAAPLRHLLDHVRCRTEEVIAVDLDANEVLYESHDGQKRSMPYDQLIITCGNTVNLSLVKGMDEHAYPLKTIGDALALQSHVMEQLEKAEVCDDPERRRWYLSFVVVGGGFSGVEVAGEINDLVRGSLRFFNNISQDDITVTVVHSRNQILPEVNESLRDFAQKKMEQCGVHFKLNAMAAVATTEGLGLKDGTFLRGGTVVCTIGTTTLPFVDRMKVPKVNGRLTVEPDMSLPGHPNVWAIGDCASVINAFDGKCCPTVGQFAERQGTQAAANVVARIKGAPTKPFSYQMLGQLCSIGGRSAVAEMMGVRISGMLAWVLWRGVYLFKLPSAPQIFKVGLEWFCDLIFPRTLAHIKADRTKRVSKAHYPTHSVIFKQGDHATDFFVIESGEVELLHVKGDTSERIAVLGTGDFFGEAALLDDRPRSLTARARTDVQVVVLGSHVFNQISTSLTPVRDAIVKAARRRTNIWQNLPEVREILNELPLSTLVEPLPCEPLPLSSTVEVALELINNQMLDFLAIVDDAGFLKGILTRSDLLRAMEVAALSDPDVDLPLIEIMASDPIALMIDESLCAAVSTMREHGLKRLPVVQRSDRRELVGYLRIENVMATVVKRMQEQKVAGAQSVVT